MIETRDLKELKISPGTSVWEKKILKPGASWRRNLSPLKTFHTALAISQTETQTVVVKDRWNHALTPGWDYINFILSQDPGRWTWGWFWVSVSLPSVATLTKSPFLVSIGGS